MSSKTEPTPALSCLLSADGTAILEVIEDLRHIQKYDIDPPRIVVCGDQSSGKSSVLEAISRLNFPRDRKTCTTFATELCLRRGPKSTPVVKIFWNDGQTEEIPARPDAVDELHDTIDRAKDLMQSRNKGNHQVFFKDVLQIKVSDPSFPPLTLVDLPGLISSGKADEDIKTVRDIVRKHMDCKNTILLAVMKAGQDLEVQAIWDWIIKNEDRRARTMGILTHPDQVEKGSERQRDLTNMIKNMDTSKLGYGWHITKNRGETEEQKVLTFEARDENEKKFFEDNNWSDSVKPENRGVDTLRSKVSEILEKHTRKILPEIIKKMNDKLSKCKLELDKLGEPLATLQDQQLYLVEISTEFQRLVEQGVRGIYEGQADFSVEQDEVTLRNMIYRHNRRFTYRMHGWGKTEEYDQDENQFRTVDPPTIKTENGRQVLRPPTQISRPTRVREVQSYLEKSKTYELPGLVNFMRVTSIFHKQSKRWADIAKTHVDDLWRLTLLFLENAMRQSTKNPHTAEVLINRHIKVELAKKYHVLQDKLQEVLKPHTKYPVMTMNPALDRRIRTTTPEGSVQKPLFAASTTTVGGSGAFFAFGQQPGPSVDMGLLSKDYASEANEMLHISDAYYETALNTFIDNVMGLVIENCLIFDLPSLFTARTVHEMAKTDINRLRQLTAEPEAVLNHRKALTAEKNDLETALRKVYEKVPASSYIPDMPVDPNLPDMMELPIFDLHIQDFKQDASVSRSIYQSQQPTESRLVSPVLEASVDTNITIPSTQSSPSSDKLAAYRKDRKSLGDSRRTTLHRRLSSSSVAAEEEL